MAELYPQPFAHLVRRAFRELETVNAIYDLRAQDFYRPAPDLDLSVTFQGRRAGNPAGPASGPHTQMAQNLVLAWLGGGRILELKTVQQNDRLRIPRPCIYVPNIGYNVEWSQELRIADSLREYVAGSMLIAILAAHEVLGHGPGLRASDTLLDLSLGYDLKGIASPEVRAFVRGLQDARPTIDALRRELPPELAARADVDFNPHLCTNVTLSTFHGCPAGEIEAIVRLLLTELDLDVVIKMNPTLLGLERTREIFYDRLGYHDIALHEEAFRRDLQFADAVAMVRRLGAVAAARGRRLGVKMCNTLEALNRDQVLADRVVYLSGEPLHCLAVALSARWREELGPDFPISFAAGIDQFNFPDAVAAGFCPVTSSTDLLRNGGFARLPKYLRRLEERMRTAGTRTIPEFVARAQGAGTPATAGGETRPAATRALLERTLADPRYTFETTNRFPRRINSTLDLFDCVSCDKCIPICPNDANFSYRTEPLEAPYQVLRVAGAGAEAVERGVFKLKKKTQIANFADVCNECGDCDTYCPEYGGPYIKKPRFFGTRATWERHRDRDGFWVGPGATGPVLRGRIRGREYVLELDAAGTRAIFRDDHLRVELDARTHEPVRVEVLAGGRDGHELDLRWYLGMFVLLRGVLDPGRVNWINVGT